MLKRSSIIAASAFIVVSVTLITMNWNSNRQLTDIAGKVKDAMDKAAEDNAGQIAITKKPICATVPTACGFPLVFYTNPDTETPEEFAERIKQYKKRFEAKWD